MTHLTIKQKLAVFSLALIAGFLYNSWPLGYLVNAKTARYGLASDLEANGQPYSWLFILADVLVGLSLLVISVLMRHKLQRTFWSKSWLTVFVGLLVFGLFTATSAASSSDCQTSHIRICVSVHKRLLGPDGIESTLAAIGLFVSLLGVNLVNARSMASSVLKQAAQVMLVAWPLSALAFVTAADANDGAHLTQQILLITSGLALLTIGLNLNATVTSKNPRL